MAVGAGIDPLTPPDCDLRGAEPPWGAFVQLAMAQFGIDRDQAEQAVAEARKHYWVARAEGAL